MEKLYDQDPYLTAFLACVLSCVSDKKGWSVVLDRTAFFPEGGGQPWDTGTLGGVPVIEVHERDGQIVHLCTAPLEVGGTVEGLVDWARRFDLMQQHSGEHIVSGLIHARYGFDNVGFHLGADTITIDFNGPMDDEGLREIEREANRCIWADRPTRTDLPTPQTLETLVYRSKKALTGQVRIVTFPGADTCACCGTHVATAGQVGAVKLLSCQKFREGVRIELLCGGRVMGYVNQLAEQNRQISTLLSAKPMETAAAVLRLHGEAQSLKARVAALEEARFSTVAQTLAGQGDVLHFEQGLTPDGLRRLADAILSVCGGRCVCFSGDDESGYQYAVGLHGGDVRALVKDLNQTFSGRGGGKPDFAQGTVHATRAELTAFFSPLS